MRNEILLKDLPVSVLCFLSQINGFPALKSVNYHIPGSTDGPVFFKNEDNKFKFLDVLGKVHYKFKYLG